jgi:hypothetical protein
METTKDRLKQYLKYKRMSNLAFEKSVNLSNGYINNMVKGFGVDILFKIAETYPELNIEWIVNGKGEMLNPVNIVQKIGNVSKNSGFVGNMSGGSVDIHHDESKDKVIEKQEQQVINMFTALIEELKGFHEVGERRDDRIKEQDAYIASIVKHSYLRNEENMKRIDKDRERLDKLIEQHQSLIQTISYQNQKIQDRADKLFDLFVKQEK